MVQKEEDEQSEENESKSKEAKLEESTLSEASELTSDSKSPVNPPEAKFAEKAEIQKGDEIVGGQNEPTTMDETNIDDGTGANISEKNTISSYPAAYSDAEQEVSGYSNQNSSPSLQEAARELEKQLTRNSIGHLLDDRPTLEELQQQGIHHGNKISPVLQATADTLERRIHTDQISHKLKNRPSLEQVKEHILPHRNVAPSLQPVRSQLQRKLSAEGLSRSLQARPSIEELMRKGIFPVSTEKTPEDETVTRRARFAIALKGAARLESSSKISSEAKGKLKDLILREDKRVMAAVEAFEIDRDVEEMLDTFCAIAKMV